MAQSFAEEGASSTETVIQQSTLQQAQAASVGQTDTASPRRQETDVLLEDTDLVVGEDTDPPPAYGYTYGEIRNEKDGLDSSASVTDYGRVNIRINQFNRRLSQIFTPALSQQTQNSTDIPSPPLPYIPPSLGGEGNGARPPPPLNVVIQVVGSRGDVQPFVALGKVLKETYRHRVRIATHPNFKSFVQKSGLEFFSIGGDPSRLMAFMVKNPGLMPGFQSLLSGDVGQRRKDVAEYIQGCWRSCYKAGDGIIGSRAAADDLAELSGNDTPGSKPAIARPFVADCIIANPPSFAHIHCAEKLGIPLHIMFTMPYSPTQTFPHPLANIQSSNADPQLTNYISYAMIELLTWQGLSDIVNRFRANCLGLDPVSVIWAPGMLQRLKIPHTYCWSPALIPKPKDWGPHISVSGFYFLDLASNYTPAPNLQEFLDAGPPPVYIGFGSIVLDDPDAMTEVIFEAARKTGQRILLSKGWGGIGTDGLRIPEGVFLLGNVPHDWLFSKHVSCVVHHGGAGTTAAGIRAGRPTVVVPFFGDQPFWGAMVARAGAGPEPIPHKQLTADKLSDAIKFCLKPESVECAKDLARKIATERGSDMGAQSFHQFLEVDRLRCTLAPSRAAAWRIKRTQVRLSAFAACTLANANLLDFHDLKLFRAREYHTDEGPWDPVSGGFTAICRALGNMAMGIADFPSETLKVLPTSSASSSKDHDMLRHTGVHTSRGFGRIAKAALESPMEISVSFTKGFHNIPKLWGDETVRPQEEIKGLKSGFKALGKEFGFGWYDGVRGLVTQPWKGAQKEGAGGFLKGVGKGIGGFLTKPGAALFSVPAYMMKGVHKEVLKLFGSNVQNYIIASRVTQGYEEWLQSSDEEKQDVIARWKLIQKYLKSKANPDEILRDVMDSQRKKSTEDSNASSALSTNNSNPSNQDHEDLTRATSSSRSFSRYANTNFEESFNSVEMSDAVRLSIQDTSRGYAEGSDAEGGDADVEGPIWENASQFQLQQQEAIDSLAYEENLRQAMACSEAEARQHAIEAADYERQLKRVIEQSIVDLRQGFSDSKWELDMGASNGEDEQHKSLRERFNKTAERAAVGSDGPSGVQRAPSCDKGHLTGTTRSEFELQQRAFQGEKTTQEKAEEEVVLEYMRKQSLLEVLHQNKGKGRAIEIDDEDDEDLHKVLKLSIQGHKVHTE